MRPRPFKTYLRREVGSGFQVRRNTLMLKFQGQSSQLRGNVDSITGGVAVRIARIVITVSLAAGFVVASPLLAQTSASVSQSKLRARDLGIPFDGVPGAFNAITDIAGVEVGYTTLIS